MGEKVNRDMAKERSSKQNEFPFVLFEERKKVEPKAQRAENKRSPPRKAG